MDTLTARLRARATDAPVNDRICMYEAAAKIEALESALAGVIAVVNTVAVLTQKEKP